MSFLGLLDLRPRPAAGVAAVALAAVEVFLDWTTWIELNVSILYSLPLVVAALARSRRLLWSLAAGLIGMTFAVYAVQNGHGAFSLSEPFFVNRVLTAMTVVLTAALLHAWMTAVDALEAHGRRLRAQNEQFDAANRELVRCRDEITRQNEELSVRRREAEEASGRKSRLLASVSHDIRSPLNAITLIAQAIRRIAADPASAAEVPGLAQRVQANALALGDLVSDVLDISSLDSGRVELHESEFSLGELLDEECRRLGPLAQAKHLTLAVDPPTADVRLRSDRVKLARVVNNLVTNAVKFTEVGGVTLTAGRTADGAVLVGVSDTGVGIAAEAANRIFDEFAQVPHPVDNRPKGWGLGLAICRRLVELMGGAISVESRPSRGSVFTVWLPPACVVGQPAGGPGVCACGHDGTASAQPAGRTRRAVRPGGPEWVI